MFIYFRKIRGEVDGYVVFAYPLWIEGWDEFHREGTRAASFKHTGHQDLDPESSVPDLRFHDFGVMVILD